MEVKHWKIFVGIGLFAYGFFAFIHAESYAVKHAGWTTFYQWSGGIALAICVIVAIIGYVGQGKK